MRLIHLGQDMTKVPCGCDNQNLADVKSVKYEYLFRAFPEYLKQLSLILKNICRFEASYVIQM